MNNRIPVRDTSDINCVGYITAESGMPVKFGSLPLTLSVVDVSDDIVSATGSVTGIQHYKEYAWNTYISNADAVTYGYPTGINSFPYS